MVIPSLGGPEKHEFHDSSLVDLVIDPQLNRIVAILSTPSADGIPSVWKLTFTGVLRFDFETLGNGAGEAFPIEIYDVYCLDDSAECERWRERLRVLEGPRADASKVRHVVLASSFYRGWGQNEDDEGINIVCRDVEIDYAPAKYSKHRYDRPTIEAGEEGLDDKSKESKGSGLFDS